MVTVKVVNQSSGNSAQGKKVSLYVKELFSGGVTEPQYTNSNGEAHFDISPTNGEVYVDGTTKYKGRLEGRMVVYI